MNILRTFLFLAAATFAAAQGVKVSELPAASALGGTEVAAVVQSGATKKATINQISTAVAAAIAAANTYQPLNAKLTGLAGLTDAAGVYTSNGSGTYSWTATSAGNNGAADSGKLVVFGSSGEIYARSTMRVYNSGGTEYNGIGSNGMTGYKNGQFVSLNLPSSPTSARAITLPDATGTVALQSGALGTPTSVTLTNGTGLPIATGVSGLGTGVATALAVAVGNSGAFVTFNGAGGTPSAITLTNGTGLPIATGISGLGTGFATFAATPTLANFNAATTDNDAASLASNTFTGMQTLSVNGAANAPALLLTGTVFSGGTASNNLAHVLVQPSGATARTTWHDQGTAFSANMPTGFTGAFIDLGINNERYLYATPSTMILQASQVRLVGGSQLWFGATGTVDISLRRLSSSALGVLSGGASELRVAGNSGGTRYAVLSNDGTDSILNNSGGGKLRIVGSATNDAATAGDVGEATAATVASGSAVSLTTATAANVASITLTAGDWDVAANVNLNFGAATHTGSSASFSTTSATLATDGSEGYNGEQLTSATTTGSVPVVMGRVSLSATTTVYLVARSTFSAGTVGAFGKIVARRRR